MDVLARIGAENRAEEKKQAAPTAERVQQQAKFLKKWAKGKPIVRQSSDSTFWAAGKWMTKIDFKLAQALADSGLATLTGDPAERGARLVMK